MLKDLGLFTFSIKKMSLFLLQVFEKFGLSLIILSKNDTRIKLQTGYYKVVSSDFTACQKVNQKWLKQSI